MESCALHLRRCHSRIRVLRWVPRTHNPHGSLSRGRLQSSTHKDLALIVCRSRGDQRFRQCALGRERESSPALNAAIG